MSYSKQISTNFHKFIYKIETDIRIITNAKTSTNNPVQAELIKLIDSELFFTSSVGAIWLESKEIKLREWK